MARFLRFELIRTREVFFILLLFCMSETSGLFASGAYDHGTSTGKGKIELDFTWNPFGIFEHGQTYIVVGYGFTDRLDFHAYFAHHEASRLDNYYFGVFYQFLSTRLLDLATAMGTRQYRQRKAVHAFFPQLLYNIKLGSGFTIGGSIVDIRTIKKDTPGRRGTAFDIAVFVPITEYFPVPGIVEEVKVGVGMFRPGTYIPVGRRILPTYSIDVRFGSKKKGNNS